MFHASPKIITTKDKHALDMKVDSRFKHSRKLCGLILFGTTFSQERFSWFSQEKSVQFGYHAVLASAPHGEDPDGERSEIELQFCNGSLLSFQ